MAGNLSALYPEFGNIINTDRTAMTYLSSSKCFEDPSGCFDYTVLNPLRKSTLGNNTSIIIIIDALDECIETGPNNNFSFLHEKIYLLPPQIKFLLTSRNISSIRTNLPSGIFVYKNPLFWEKKFRGYQKVFRTKIGK